MSMRRKPQAFIKVEKEIQDVLDKFDTDKNDNKLIRKLSNDDESENNGNN